MREIIRSLPLLPRSVCHGRRRRAKGSSLVTCSQRRRTEAPQIESDTQTNALRAAEWTAWFQHFGVGAEFKAGVGGGTSLDPPSLTAARCCVKNQTRAGWRSSKLARFLISAPFSPPSSKVPFTLITNTSVSRSLHWTTLFFSKLHLIHVVERNFWQLKHSHKGGIKQMQHKAFS